MKITKTAMEHIKFHTKNCISETGGIMGSYDGEVISEIIMDTSDEQSPRCYYAPNVDFFNKCIDDWQCQGKHFMGIFHTHFYNIKTLSAADTRYITAILLSMPEEICELFFPVFVFPDRKLVCYRAYRENNSVKIKDDILEII